MSKPKKAVNLRLSEDTIRELAAVAKQQGVSQADVVTVLVHLYYTNGDIDSVDEWFTIARMS